MKRIIRIMMLLAAMTVTAGQAWARGAGNICIITGTVLAGLPVVVVGTGGKVAGFLVPEGGV